jgi:hypothetical protein
MAIDCPLPSCDGVMNYDTCEECGYREATPRPTQSGGAGTRRHMMSDEYYKHQIIKIQRLSEE